MATQRKDSLDDASAARLAIEANWPERKPGDDSFDGLVESLVEMRRKLGCKRFDLVYNLRPPSDRVEQWSRDVFQQKITMEEYRELLRADVNRPLDLEMVTALYDSLERKLGRYSLVVQTVIDLQLTLRPTMTPRRGEQRIRKAIDDIDSKHPLWKEHLAAVFDYAEELRVRANLGLLEVGEFRCASAFWLTQLVLNRIVDYWRSCEEIARRSRKDPRYLYATTALRLFGEVHLRNLPRAQDVLEHLRQEFVRAKLALRNCGNGAVHESSHATTVSSPGKLARIAHGADRMRASTAFISYAWDSQEHKDWARNLAVRLRSDGIDATLDQWEAAPGDHLPQLMELAIAEHDFVLIVCTPNYKRRSDQRVGGVGYEGDIMSGELLQSRDHRKFIPILRSGDHTTAIPVWLIGKLFLNFTQSPFDENEYERLLATLRNQREEKPPLGSSPTSGI